MSLDKAIKEVKNDVKFFRTSEGKLVGYLDKGICTPIVKGDNEDEIVENIKRSAIGGLYIGVLWDTKVSVVKKIKEKMANESKTDGSELTANT